MSTKADVVAKMVALGPEYHPKPLRALTRDLIGYRENPGLEKLRFEGTKLRGIPGFGGELLPNWSTVVVTGGTGCVGHAVLSRLADDLPSARLVSVARHPPAVGRRVDRVIYLRGDVCDLERISEIMRGERPHLVLHLAAQRQPAYAEDHIVETVSTNVLGTSLVLQAAGEAGVDTVVVASTGKAVRLFTSDVYAASKKLVEYIAADAANRYEMKVSCTRFTHVVDNSIVRTRVLDWISRDEPIRLHSPDVLLPIQSALECYHLLMMAGAVAETATKGIALRDLGWPPISLLDMSLDYLAEAPASRSPIIFTGYPAGYEAFAYPGTYDPMTAGDVSPLINCEEALRTSPARALGDYLDEWPLAKGTASDVDDDLAVLVAACPREGEAEIGRLLRTASVTLLDHLIHHLPPERLQRIHQLGGSCDRSMVDHDLIHEHLGSQMASVASS